MAAQLPEMMVRRTVGGTLPLRGRTQPPERRGLAKVKGDRKALLVTPGTWETDSPVKGTDLKLQKCNILFSQFALIFRGEYGIIYDELLSADEYVKKRNRVDL